jgi:hypothetical protein
MQHLTKFYCLVFLFFAELIFPTPSKATHTAGAEVSYTHLTGSMYKLRVVLYRDCFGIPAPLTVSVNAHSDSCGSNTDYVLDQIAGTGNEISHPCPTSQTTCNGGNSPGYQKWEYELDVSLFQCSDWVFTFGSCCRDGCNIINPGTPMTVQAHLDNSTYDNSSPEFLNNPEFVICSMQDFHFNLGAQDPDGDSLAYHFIDAIGATYVFPYSGQYPIESVPPATFDSITGDFLVNPTMSVCGVIAFEVMEFRNTQLIGSVIREINLYTTACSNTIPTESGMNGTTQQVIYVLPDDTICFDIFSTDPDIGDTLTISWDQSIPAATFTTAGSPFPTGTFCWTPGIGDVRSQPYLFTSSIMDNNCPTMGINIYSFFIYVTLDSSLVFIEDSERSYYSDLSIYPNPSDGNFMMKPNENISSVKIFDHSGKVIKVDMPQNGRMTLNAQDGVYWIEIKYNDGRRLTQKLIVKK